MNKNILFGVISILLGATFLFSAYIKIFPIELFEFSFIEIKVANWNTAPFIARLFLAFEFFVGLMLILNYNGGNRKLAKFTVGLLLFFTIYLIAIIIFQGNSGNCGCFGNYIKLTPLESIFKNLFLISFTLPLFLAPKQSNVSNNKVFILSACLASLITPFVINPISYNPPPSEHQINYKLKLDSLYLSGKKNIPKEDLRKGKRVIAFLSLTCPHCRIGAQKLNIIHEQRPEIPFYFILNGDKSDLTEFLDESKTKTIDYSFMSVQDGFIDNAGLSLPAILWVNNLNVEQRTTYLELNEEKLLNWFNN